MKRLAVALFAICFVLILTSAQEQLPTEQKVTFGQDGKMYVNKNLGVYLWLSTSPEKDAPKHRLKSDSTDKYSNPMYFDTEGFNTLRSPSAVDQKTKRPIYPLRDIVFEVYADGESPTTNLKRVTGKSIYRNGKLYYGGNPGFTLPAIDKVSGLEKTYYSVNGKRYQEYRDTLKITDEGETTLKIYSTDRVGNRENPIEKKFTVDNSAPATEYEIDGILNKKFVSPKATIKLKSKDNLVGVKAIYYQINNGPKRAYSTPVSVKQLGAGGAFSFYAIDYLGNVEKLQVIGGKGNELNMGTGESNHFEFYVDNLPPSFEIEFDGATSQGKYNYISGKTKIKIKANDDKSGVDQVYYSINSTKVDQKYKDGIEFTDNGMAYIRVNAVDYVGNKSTTVTNAYYVDTKAPVSKSIVNSPKHRVKDTIFVTSKTKIGLTATDAASGVRNTYYTINSGAEQEYKGPFMLTKEGLNSIKHYAKDNVDNEEETKILEVFVDNLAPEIFHHFSSTPIGAKTVREQEYTIYPGNVKLYIAATDKHAGGERIVYSINGGTKKSSNPIKGFAAGNYEIEVTAYDVLGNSSNQTIKFSVE